MSRDPRYGLTLVELLTVIAILGVLVGLLLPAVQAARSAARRTTCANHSKQIAVALLGHSDQFGCLPPGTAAHQGPHPLQGWLAAVLPFLEQRAIFDETERAYSASPSPFVTGVHVHFSTAIGVFGCPEDSHSLRPALSNAYGLVVGPACYIGVNGVDANLKRGSLYYDSQVRLADVTDGLSNTLAFGERPLSPGRDLGWWYAGTGIDGYGTGDHTLGVHEAGPSQFALHRACGNGPFPFGQGSLYDECAALHFWSLHAGGGGHFARLDGSVKFMPYSSASVLKAMSTRAGGEPVAAE
jgi:prepilin-type N-terminal cleavage/methylation domain-containing protein